MRSEPMVYILLIEDNREVSLLLRTMLGGYRGMSCEAVCAGTLDEGLNIFKRRHIDLILLDLTLPDSEGIATLKRARSSAPHTPIVILTGIDDESLGLEAVRCGAQDYLTKAKVDADCLMRSIRYALERHRIEEELIKARDQLEEKVKERTAQLKESCERLKRTQEELIQAAKLQVVGTLASGVAHEVKNPLAIILQGVGYLKKNTPGADTRAHDTLAFMEEAIARADSIIKGLLDFAGPSRLSLSACLLNDIAERALLFVKHKCDRKHIRLVREYDESLSSLSLDRRKIEQALINLLVNAADAMSGGGTLTLRTLSLDKKSLFRRYTDGVSFDEGAPGFAAVEVEDTGEGIADDIRDKIRDPFFTTKRAKGGTGLGLSIVRSIIQMHNAQLYIGPAKAQGTRAALIFRQEPKKGGLHGEKENTGNR